MKTSDGGNLLRESASELGVVSEVSVLCGSELDD
jgi:hypothetical protein